MRKINLPEGTLKLARAVAEAMPRGGTWLPSRWKPKFRRFSDYYRIGREQCCPMGFLPGSLHPTPGNSRDAGGKFSDRAVKRFGIWWDSLNSESKIRSALKGLWELRKPA